MTFRHPKDPTFTHGDVVVVSADSSPVLPVVAFLACTSLLKDDVDRFSPVLPVVVNLRNEGLQDRHWEQIHSLIGFDIQGRPEITLAELLDKKVTDYHEEITGVATSAVQEGVLESMMSKVASMWQQTEFEVRRKQRQPAAGLDERDGPTVK